MFKFISPNGKENQFSSKVVEIPSNESPVKEILNRGDFSNYSIAKNERVYSLEDSFQIRVNVKDVGSFYFIFDKNGFPKDELINNISALRNIEVIDSRTAQNKVNALLNIVDIPCLLFILYEKLDDLYIDEDFFKRLPTHEVQIFIIEQEQEEVFYELSIGQQEEIPQTGKNKKKKSSSKGNKKNKVSKESTKHFLKQLGDKKFHFLLIIVSTILFEVSIPLAIVNVYASNAIYIFLFICSVIGIGMNGYSFYDLFKKFSPKDPLSIASYVSNLIGLGAGVGLFALFYNLSNLEEGVPSMGSMIWVGLLVSAILCAATVAVTFFIPKPKKK